jgi:hypothetical protein
VPVIRPHFDPDQPVELIEAALDTFDFTLPGRDKSLGRDLAVRVASGIAQRSLDGKDPDGNDWPPNSDNPKGKGYATYKLKRYDVDRPGELGGQMLSLLSLMGNVVVTPNRIEMTYGIDTPPQRPTARNGVPLKDHELIPTDREKGDWFTNGNSRTGQPPRRFFEFDEEIAASLVTLVSEFLQEYLRAAGLAGA